MKISFTRGFDSDDVIQKLKAAKVEGLDEFVQNVSEVLDKLSQFVQKNITLADNVDQVTNTYLIQHNKALIISPPTAKKKVKAILPIQSSSWDNPITSFNWRYNLEGNIELKALFLDAPKASVNVTVTLFH